MNRQISKGQAVLFIVTCWATAFAVMWQMPEMVIVNDLYFVFPEQSGIITAMLSWPSLLTALSSLLAGSLLQKLSTKTELIIGGAAMLVMIFAPTSNNIYLVFVCSLIAAFGAGFSNTAGMAVLSEVLIDENLRSRHMGFYNAVMSLIGAVISYLAGVLALSSWQSIFQIYWFAIPMLIMTFLFIPDIKPGDRLQNADGSASDQTAPGAREGFGGRFWIFFFSMFLFFMAYVPLSSYLSVYISENNLGSTAFAGTCTSLATVGSCVSCLFFGFIYAKTKRKISILVLALDIILFLWAMLSPTPISALIASIGSGASYGAIFSLCYAYSAEIVPFSRIGMAMGLMTFNYAIGISVGVYVTQWLMGIFGSLTKTLLLTVIFCSISLIIEIISSIQKQPDTIHENNQI